MSVRKTDAHDFDLKQALERLFARAGRLTLPDIVAAGDTYDPRTKDDTPIGKLSISSQRLEALSIRNQQEIERLWRSPERDCFESQERIMRLLAECDLIEFLHGFELAWRFSDIRIGETHELTVTAGYDVCSRLNAKDALMPAN